MEPRQYPAPGLDIFKGAEWLEGKARCDYSQFGEDGLIEACFERFGALNNWAFEVGAGDGATLSNTKRLVKLGWSVLWIEQDEQYREALLKNSSPATQVVIAEITPYNVDEILMRAKAPIDLDFASIDIDGQDFWVWAAMRIFQPRIVCIEYSPYVGPNHLPGLGEDGRVGKNQAGLKRIMDLGFAKGYRPLCKTNVNVIWARRDL
jgi:hypothetical protein